jgi:hypothetical protein
VRALLDKKATWKTFTPRRIGYLAAFLAFSSAVPTWAQEMVAEAGTPPTAQTITDAGTPAMTPSLLEKALAQGAPLIRSIDEHLLQGLVNTDLGDMREDLLELIRQRGIIHGQPNDTDTSVGVLLLQNKAHCTATVVSSRTLLTAAHCVERVRPEDLIFFVGADAAKLTAGRSYRLSKEYRRHSLYSRTDWVVRNDLALLYLTNPAPRELTPVRLPQTTIHLAPGNPVQLVGYGYAGMNVFGTPSTGLGRRRSVQQTISVVETDRF